MLSITPERVWRTSNYGSVADSSDDEAFERLWLGFMTARVAVAVLLSALVMSLYVMGTPPPHWVVAICMAYLLASAYARVTHNAERSSHQPLARWARIVGVDILAFGALHIAHLSGVTFAPLFAMPVLMAGVFASRISALAVAAGVVLLLLADAWGLGLSSSFDIGSRVAQAGVSGMGFFALALLANQLAGRLKGQLVAVKYSQLAARTQTEVNRVVVEALNDGVIVVDVNGVVRSANPAAARLMALGQSTVAAPFALAANPAWQALAELAADAFAGRAKASATLQLGDGTATSRIAVRQHLVAVGEQADASLCILFLEDLLDVEARIRKDKLASMGRMSAAVAHEIRNPLAAITQANALLCEEFLGEAQKRLGTIIADNAMRLERIVEDVLSVSRTGGSLASSDDRINDLGVEAAAICAEWCHQHGNHTRLKLQIDLQCSVYFESGHLRQVLINLLDNASRYATADANAIRVESSEGEQFVSIGVWSDGQAISPIAQTHLFEPFFSSESRSTGLGLFICRELCDRHQAQIGFKRSLRGDQSGNEFTLTLRKADSPAVSRPAPLPALPTQAQ